MRKTDSRNLALYAMVAALYVAITLITYPLSFGSFQIRIAEALVLLCFFNRKYFFPLILGCVISNMFSPLGFPDVFFGTLATACSLICIMLSRKLWVASLYPVLINGIIIAIELMIFDPTIYDMDLGIFLTLFGTIALGEFISVSIIGVLLFSHFRKNQGFMDLIEANQNLT